jgi:hypothetical protein
MIHRFSRICESVGMALPPSSRRQRLLAVVADRNRPLKHAQRAHIMLFSAYRLPVQEMARRAGVSRPAVWRWQARYAEQGVDGVLRDIFHLERLRAPVRFFRETLFPRALDGAS